MTKKQIIPLAGYQITEPIYESANSLVYRGIREDDRQKVILKRLKENYPTPSEIARYKQEYEITLNLNIEGVVRVYDMKSYHRSLVMILEDFGGSSLKHLLHEHLTTNQELSLEEFLDIAIKTTKILGEIHSTNIIHKDINPTNIVYNSETKQLKIIDFGISTQLTRENTLLKNPNVLEGTLAYMSPEQTGRMNRILDYRTDFYSLGITFYELLTGKLPFETTDALELVHCHIAKQPIPADEVDATIPKAVSDIVMKLMAKTAEDRYKSAWGIQADLAECLHQLQAQREILDLTLGTQDISDKFQIPQKLYGREAEVDTLLAAFERVAARTDFNREPRSNGDKSQFKIEMMLVAGYSGIGKSALVQEIYKPITEKRGYFISGKFDQFQRNIPYSAIVAAFKELVGQLLTESESQLKQWKEKLLTALGSNGQVIIDVIPEVELIVGKQPPVPELGLTESRNRFNFVFQNFIRACCTQEHPLVIFLDDVQWTDSATLNLIKLMMIDADTQYLFLIGAYRNNEVNANHPLMMTLEEIRAEGTRVNQITLTPLQSKHISQLIAETLHSDTSSVKPLAELVAGKTGGNPFFVNEFLKTLHSENLLTFNPPYSSLTEAGSKGAFWQWNIAEIEAQGITDNVVELTIGKLKKLPDSTQQVLRLAACVGASFDLHTLSIICEKSPEEISIDLTIAVQSGLILPISELDEKLLIQNYKFAHDRIQQAAYAFIENDRKKAVHLQIGRLLLANISAEDLPEKVFEIVDHLNIGWELISDQLELIDLAKLNLEAGKKAKDSMAYAAALDRYFCLGIEVLPGDIWNEHYELTFNLYRERSECEYLCGNFDRAEELFDLILTQAKSNFDRADIYSIRLVLYDNTGKYLEALSISSEALKTFELNVPTSNKSEILLSIESELQLYRSNLEKIKIAELMDAPKMTHPEIKACMKLLINTITPAYYTDQDVFTLTSLKMVNLSIQYGNSKESAYGYGIWGTLAGARLVDYEAGYEFGQLAMRLTEQFNNANLACKVFNAFGGMTSPWRSHLKQSIPILRKGYFAGVETGDIYVGPNSYNLILQRIIAADNFSSILEESKNYLDFLNQTKNPVFAGCQKLYQHFLFSLQGLTQDKFSFSDDEFDESQCLQMWKENAFLPGVTTYSIFKTQILFLYGDYEKALSRARESQNSLVFISGLPHQAEHYLYYSLNLTALYPLASEVEQKEYREILETNQKQMKIWADNCPENFLHKYLLVDAEIARISGKEIEAIDLYDRAISSARENKFLQNEALASELAAKFWLSKSKEEFAQLYMKKAHYGYQLWGAKRKVEDLEEKYPELLYQSSATQSMTSRIKTTTNTTTGSRSGEALDLATFMKASQAISGEIVLDKLLANLMKILIENAGAQIGFLILDKAGEWVIEASGEVDVDKVTVLQSISIDQHLPISMVNYVTRTRETVVKTDAANQGKFTNDPYIKANKTKSILCAPLIDRGQLSGIIYLENNLTTGAFTADRLEVIQVLSGQAAIAITNAKLYAEVTKSERRLTQYLEAMPVGVSVHTPTGQLHYANQAAQQLLSINIAPEAKTDGIAEAYQIYCAGSQQLYPNDQLPIVRSLAGETVRADDLELHQPDRILPLEVSTTPIFDDTGKIVYAIAAFQDITDRKQAQKILEDYNRTLERQVTERTEALKEKNQQLSATLEQLQATQSQLVESEKMASLGGLVAGVAHEVNTPVGIGITAASLLAEKTTGFYEIFKSGQMKRSQLEKFLDTAMQTSSMVLSNLNRAADLIQSFKQVAVDQSTEEQRKFNLKQYLYEVLIPLQPKLRTTPHRVEIKGDESLQLNTYPGAFSQIITNFVMNSLTHAYSPEDAGNLVFEFFKVGEQIVFEYSDNGQGIAKDNLSKIFDPFFTTKRGQGGTGLGLHIVYNLVTQKLNGTIECESQVGVGTKFIIKLPIEPPKEL